MAADRIDRTAEHSSPVTSFRPAQVARVQLADQVVERLRDFIVQGSIARGDRLPSEATLSHDFGVGRSTIREALKVLGHLGLIETRPGSGSYVTGSVHDGDRDIRPPSADELFELFEFRLALESEISQLAAQRRTPVQLAHILHDLEELHEVACGNEPGRLITADLRLHRSVAAASGNRHLMSIYEQYQPQFETGTIQLISMQESSHIGDVHDDLVDAIAAKDVRGAAAAVRRTFDEIRMRLKLLA